MHVITNPHSDVFIVGGGVIGLSIAYFLSSDGVSVTVVDQGQPGQEASWAGAGMLPPGNLAIAVEPASRLRALSHQLWKNFSRELKDLVGIDNGYVESGGIELAFAGESSRLQAEVQAWDAEGVAVESLCPEKLRQLEPAISLEIESAYRLSQLSQVRNPRHLKALAAACLARGVRLIAGAGVQGFRVDNRSSGGRRILAAQTLDQEFSAAKFIIAGGAWTQGILTRLGVPGVPIKPVRGQIALLSAMPLPFTHVLNCGPRYLVPRPDGRILIGSTEDHVGFDKSNTVSGVSGLLAFAQRIVPQLSTAKIERTWAGLRPGSPNGNPYLSQIPNSENGYIAAGHFRAGLQLSPATGTLMAQLVTGRPVDLNLDAFQLTLDATQESGEQWV